MGKKKAGKKRGKKQGKKQGKKKAGKKQGKKQGKKKAGKAAVKKQGKKKAGKLAVKEQGKKNKERMNKEKEREKKAQNESEVKVATQRAQKIKKYRELVVKAGKRCTKVRASLGKAAKDLKAQSGVVSSAMINSKRMCDLEKKKKDAVKEKKQKVAVSGPTFKWDDQHPCKAGKGHFVKKLKQDERVTVGVVPAGIKNPYIKLRSDKDLDTELWDTSAAK